MYRSILIALDLESESDNPLTSGLRLAAEHGGVARVVSVIRPALLTGKGFFTADIIDKDDLLAQARQALQARLALHGAEAVATDVLVGDPADTVAGVAEYRNCDLVVIGARQRSASETFFGTTATNILRQTKSADVYACHRSDPRAAADTVLVAIDGSEITPQVLDEAQQLIESNLTGSRPDVYIVCVVDDIHREHDLIERAQGYVRASRLASMPLQLMEGEVNGCLDQLIGDFDADLLIIGSGRNFGPTWYVGSTTNTILHEAACDVLVIRPND